MNEDSSELTLKTYPGDIAPLMKLLKSRFWIYNSNNDNNKNNNNNNNNDNNSKILIERSYTYM